jgi:hypothetical protein
MDVRQAAMAPMVMKRNAKAASTALIVSSMIDRTGTRSIARRADECSIGNPNGANPA